MPCGKYQEYQKHLENFGKDQKLEILNNAVGTEEHVEHSLSLEKCLSRQKSKNDRRRYINQRLQTARKWWQMVKQTWHF